MKYTKKHIEAVEKRLQQYEDALASPKFRQLRRCGICRTVGVKDRLPDCSRCLLNHNGTLDSYGDPQMEGCVNPDDGWMTGAWCDTKQDQRRQFKHLLRQLGKNGYEWR